MYENETIVTPETPEAFVARHSRVVTLPDGAEILVRPISPADRDPLLEAFTRMSDESRWYRFLRPMSRLSAREVTYLTEIDYFDHFAWGAGTTGNPPDGIGVARYVRDTDDPVVAEAAVAVVDEWQGRGVGTILLELLALSAAERGVKRFRAFVAPSNEKARDLVEGLGATERQVGSLRVVEIEVPGTESPIRGTPLYDALVAAASGDLELEPPPRRDEDADGSPNLSPHDGWEAD